MRNPFLAGDKIYLRPIEESDLNEKYQSWFNDAEVCQFNSHHRFPHYQQDMEDYYKHVIKSGNNLILAIISKNNDEHIGNVSLQDIDVINKSAEFAILIGDKTYWSKGIGKEAIKLIIDHGFNTLNLNRIYCGTAEDNVGMQKLAELAGFNKEGISKEALFKNGKYKDIFNYGLLKNEYKK